MPRTKDAVPKSEADIRKAYVKTASIRTEKAIRALANLAKLTPKGRKPNDADAIVSALRKAVDTVESRLKSAAPVESGFKLPE